MKVWLLEFDDRNEGDMSKFIECFRITTKPKSRLIIPFSSKVSSESTLQIDEIVKKNTKLESDKKELERDIERFRKEGEEKQKEIEAKDSCIDNLKDELDKEKKTVHDYAEKLKEEQSKYIELQRKTTEERENLEQMIKKIKERYDPDTGGSPGEDQFYNVKGDVLVQTTNYKAPYIARKLSEGESYCFQFNRDKGPECQACKDRENMLIPFCTITEETPDANSIGWVKWGKAKSTAANTLKVETKAEIKLIKV